MKAAFRAGALGMVMGAALPVLLVAPAHAQYGEELGLPTSYAGPFIGYAIPDSDRNAGKGVNLQLTGGLSLIESLAVELSLFSTKFPGDAGSSDVTLTGLGLDLALGTPAAGNPVFLIGAGSVKNKGGSDKTTTFGNLGLGVYLPFTFSGELWRLEGRYRAVFDEPDMLEDTSINLGFLYAFGREELPEQAPEADADGDGVPDASDRCADTPRWVRADANGCTPDSDADGVDDTRDDCPASPAGGAVGPNGCEVSAAPPEPELVPVPVAPAAPADEDGDGIADADDRCPHTPPGMKVDAQGCVIPEEVQLRNVHFDSSSSRLTGDGYILLRALAATLKANPGMKLEVQGHADASGGTRMNQELSTVRAEVVRDFLTYLGIAEERFRVKAFGEMQPLNDNRTRESRAYNRRVQFVRFDE